ncbi:MAG TPA: hypothetical protein PKG56_03295 [Chitinophagaceae bacterium]|nr:hypothetical protein [Chitinophagaceae bacterium]
MNYLIKTICFLSFFAYQAVYTENIEKINIKIINSIKSKDDVIKIESLFKKLIKKSTIKGNAYFRFANYYASIDSIEKAIHFYKKAINQSPYYYYIQNDKELNATYYLSYRETDYISKEISLFQKQEIDSFFLFEIKKRKWFTDSTLLHNIILIQETDKPIRSKMSEAYTSKDSTRFRLLFDSLKHQQPYFDSINYQKINILINKNGWLDFSNISFEGANIVWTILQHIPNKYKKQYLSKYKASAFKGNSSIGKYSSFLDRYLFFDKRKCLYAPQPYSKTASINPKELEYSRVKEPKRLNVRRLKIGLSTLP